MLTKLLFASSALRLDCFASSFLQPWKATGETSSFTPWASVFSTCPSWVGCPFSSCFVFASSGESTVTTVSVFPSSFLVSLELAKVGFGDCSGSEVFSCGVSWGWVATVDPTGASPSEQTEDSEDSSSGSPMPPALSSSSSLSCVIATNADGNYMSYLSIEGGVSYHKK